MIRTQAIRIVQQGAVLAVIVLSITTAANAEKARKLPADSYISTVKIEVAAARNLQGQPGPRAERLRNAEAMADSCLMYYAPYPAAYYWKADIATTRFDDVGNLAKKAEFLAIFLTYADSLDKACANDSIKASYRKDCPLLTAVVDSTRLRFWRDRYNDAVNQAKQVDTMNQEIKKSDDTTYTAEIKGRRDATADSALANFKMAIQIDNGNGDAYVGLGNVSISMGKVDEAIEFLRAAVEKTTPEKRSVLIYNLAYMYAQKEDYCHAAPYFSEYWKGHPDDIESGQNLAICFANCKMGDSALAIYHAILKAKPDHSDALNAIGTYYVSQAREFQSGVMSAREAKKEADEKRFAADRDRVRDSARVYLKMYYDAKPDDASAAFEYGLMAYATNKTDDAIAALEKAAKLDPKNADALITLGDLYQGKGKFNEAIATYEQALELQPDNKALMESLKTLYTDLGKNDKLTALQKRMK